MARTAIAAFSPPGSKPVLPLGAGSAQLTGQAADAVNFNSTPCTGREMVIVHNTDVGAQTVTFHSVADAFNRTGDITAYSIPAGKKAVFGPFRPSEWRQADGNLYIDASSANVLIDVVTLPGMP
jgi:hypothetical protein